MAERSGLPKNYFKDLSTSKPVGLLILHLASSLTLFAVFNSNFAEGISEPVEHLLGTPRKATQNTRRSHPQLNMILDEFEDSDDEDDESPQTKSRRLSSSDGTDDCALSLPDSNPEDVDKFETQSTISDDQFGSPPTDPSNNTINIRLDDETNMAPKMTIVVRDAAYNTYRAMLYYVSVKFFIPLSFSTTSPNKHNRCIRITLYLPRFRHHFLLHLCLLLKAFLPPHQRDAKFQE